MADEIPEVQCYIHTVHHLIEECIILKLSREKCMEALSNHANIPPVITSTVWKELEKENKEFFEAYNQNGSIKILESSRKEENA